MTPWDLLVTSREACTEYLCESLYSIRLVLKRYRTHVLFAVCAAPTIQALAGLLDASVHIVAPPSAKAVLEVRFADTRVWAFPSAI